MPTQILLRTDKELHQNLLREAQLHHLSLNELCTQRLSVPSSLEGKDSALLRQVISAATRLYGDRLKGVLFYGSRARGTAHTGSDWDFLCVMDRSASLNRELYRIWDEGYPGFSNPDIEVHFAQLPEKTSVATGFWGELALDAFVIFERDFAVSLHLNRVRREIADGKIVRRMTHGQAYWIHREVA